MSPAGSGTELTGIAGMVTGFDTYRISTDRYAYGNITISNTSTIT